ncbi:basic salivary proline-rich protein 2-like isoform X2 [Oenanthe melanoleuca]|uniref:basic salivary proline-rich protein 2-like isoform X2 n=1 Tax=Oenanthe melanoleuca TaxID=2939378 RepID=UPI0024C14D77|nr:basic salivary proline-rich protein 2-like isoform X2 [Oenanthe melanoleuca]
MPIPPPGAVFRGIARRVDTGRAPSGTAGTPEPGGRRQAAAARLSLPGSASGTTLSQASRLLSAPSRPPSRPGKRRKTQITSRKKEQPAELPEPSPCPQPGAASRRRQLLSQPEKDSAVGKLQRRLPGTAPQNGPPPTGLPQRMGQLQPPVIPVRFEICAEGWQLLLGQELHLPRGKAAASSSPGTVSMQEAAQGTGRGARAGTRPQQEQPWHTDTGG